MSESVESPPVESPSVESPPSDPGSPGPGPLADLVRTEVAAVLGVAPADIALDDRLTGAHRVDSLELVEIGVRLERALGRRLPVTTVEGVRSVRDFVDALDAHLRVGA